MDGSNVGGVDDDGLFLERVLDQLYDFGNGSQKKQKKRKRKQCDEERDEALPAADDIFSKGVTDGEQTPTKTHTTAPTAPSVQQRQVEVVTFQDPTKRQRTRQQQETDQTPQTQTTEATAATSDQHEDLTLETARLEVHRFGITGYKKEQQRVFEQDRAIMLGARPPKKQFTNYKVLQEQIKEKKQKSREEVDTDLRKKRKKKKIPRDRKVSSGSGSAPTGHMGRFKNGMLILSAQDIQKMKGKHQSR